LAEADLAPFAALNSHPQVVEWLGSSPTRAESDAMAARWSVELEAEGWGLWALEVVGGAPFVGVCGLHRTRPPVPGAPAVEVGWRLDPAHWGNGYATEAAAAAHRLRRDPGDDFDHPSLAEGSPLRAHVLYRAGAGSPRPG
jgi:ribosomal-protein-alanine N-acetyltransferase